MALPRTRETSIFDDSIFNLGMDDEALARLGLMNLPSALTTVANPDVASQLQSQLILNEPVAKTSIPTVPADEMPVVKEVLDSGNTLAQAAQSADTGTDLFGFDTTMFKPGIKVEDAYDQFLKRKADTGGLEYWTKEIGPTVEADELSRFLEAAAPERERVAATQTPDIVNVRDLYKQVLGREDVSPQDLAFWSKELGGSISPAEVERFMAAAKPELETSKFTPFSNLPDPSTFQKFEGRSYDPRAYENLLNQLTSQQKYLESKGMKYGSTFGGAQETVQDLAKRLASVGISSVYDLGMKHELPVEKIYQTIPQDEGPSLQIDTGKYRTISGVKGRNSEGDMDYEYRELTPDEVKKLKFDKSGAAFLPVGKSAEDELMNTPFATTKYYNKKTGEEIDTRKIGGKAESGLFASSGAGDGYTNYRVRYTADGTPVIIPEKNLSGMKEFIAEDLSGIMSVLRFIPGAQIPLMIAQAAAAAHMGADPKDILKQLAISAVSSNLDKIVPMGFKELGIDMPTSDLGKLALKAGTSGLSSLIQGGDLEQALKSGVISAASSGLSSLIPKGDIGGLSYGRILELLAPSIAKGELTNADIFRIMSSMAKDEAKKGKTPGKP